jgi:hypothetical protein
VHPDEQAKGGESDHGEEHREHAERGLDAETVDQGPDRRPGGDECEPEQEDHQRKDTGAILVRGVGFMRVARIGPAGRAAVMKQR